MAEKNSSANWLTKLKNIILLPYHAALILTSHKAFGTPLIGSERLNRRGLHIWRIKLAHLLAERRRQRLACWVSDEDRDAFARNGYVEKRGVLTPEEYAELRVELGSLVVQAREMTEGTAVTQQIAITPALLKEMPMLRHLLDSGLWRGLTRYVGSFDVESNVCIQTVFAKPSADREAIDPQTRLHMDTFHPTMKAWFFLDNVAADLGPFTYVPGSHRLSRRRLAWQRRKSILVSRGSIKGGAFRVPEADLPRLRLPPAHAFIVPGNTLVVGDTFGLHGRAPSVHPSTRVSIHASMRHNPFNPFTFVPAACLPWLKGRWILVDWWLEDLRVRLLGGRRIWRDVGRVSPGARKQS